MRRLITAEQAQFLDQQTQLREQLSAEELMERAGAAVARHLHLDFPEAHNIVILVGPGNNGGDGMVIAKHLLSVKKVVVLCPSEGTSALWRKKKAELAGAQTPVVCIEPDEVKSFIDTNAPGTSWDLFIDAAFGVGLSRPLSDQWQRLLEVLQRSSRATVAVDLPSGLDGTTGLAAEGVAAANVTYTFGWAKLGMLIGDGPSLCGRIKVLPIGFSRRVFNELKPQIRFLGHTEAQKLLPQPSSWKVNKARRGHLLVLAGSPGMEGAGALVCRAAARMGAGYVTWARWPQVGGYQIHPDPHLLVAELDSELKLLKSHKPPTAVVVGPGLGLGEQSVELIKNVYKYFHDLPVVIDADALHLLKQAGVYPVPRQWILTPHSGELEKLLSEQKGTTGKSSKSMNDLFHPKTGESVLSVELARDRLAAALSGQSALGGYLLLKGYRSILVGPDGKVVVLGSGGPALAKAGTGDVLAGMIGGLLASGYNPSSAAALGAFIHGRAGDLYNRRFLNDFSLVASDLPDLIPTVVRQMVQRRRHE